MTHGGSAAFRWSRASLLAVVSFLTGAVAHVSAGGLLPGATSLALLLLLVTCACAVLLGRSVSTARVVVLVMAGQSFIHVALTATAGHRGDPVATAAPAPLLVQSTAGRRGSLLDQMPQPAAAPLEVPAWVDHVVADLTGPHAFMALSHLAAAALIGLWLASGERAFFDVLAMATAAVVRLLFAPPPAAPAPVVVAGTVPAVRRAQLLLSRSLVRRGPPLAG